MEMGSKNKMHFSIVATVAMVTTSIITSRRPQHIASAYVTSGLPRHKHHAWLKKITCDICESPPGDLTQEEISTAPQIMSAWAQNPYIPSSKSSRSLERSCSSLHSHHGKECALAVESLLKRLIEERRAGNEDAIATTAAYNAMLEGWARSGEGGAAAERCEQILIEMQDLYTHGDEHVQPNADSFRSVIIAWLDSGEQFALQRAQRVLEWMIRLHEAGSNDLATPDAACFDAILQSWSRSGHEGAPQKAEELLVWMESLHNAGNDAVKPRTSTFNAVLATWAKSSDSLSARRAHDILHHMETLSKTGNEEVKPNMVSYSTVAAALAKSGDAGSAHKAEEILHQVEVGCKAGDASLRPDTILYNHVIDSWAKSGEKGAHHRARAVLDRQIRLHKDGVKKCRPDIYSYTSVLNSCAAAVGSNKERRNAFHVAVLTFEELLKSDSILPNHVTYGTVLKACARLLPAKSKQRQKWVRKVFEMACHDGYVGEMVLKRFREASTPELYKEFLEGHDKNDLPQDWTRNVNEQRKKRKMGMKRRKRPSLMP